jgi:hypothetical protein
VFFCDLATRDDDVLNEDWIKFRMVRSHRLLSLQHTLEVLYCELSRTLVENAVQPRPQSLLGLEQLRLEPPKHELSSVASGHDLVGLMISWA